MERANNKIFNSEFIGKYAKVNGRGIEGKIIDETKNSFLIKTGDNIKNGIEGK